MLSEDAHKSPHSLRKYNQTRFIARLRHRRFAIILDRLPQELLDSIIKQVKSLATTNELDFMTDAD